MFTTHKDKSFLTTVIKAKYSCVYTLRINIARMNIRGVKSFYVLREISLAFPKDVIVILCLWVRASLIYTNNCPTSCNTKQSIYYSACSLYMFRVSTIPIIRSTQNCNYSLRYCAATSLQRGQACPRWKEVAAQKYDQYRRL